MKIIVIGLGSMGRRRIRLLKQMYSDIELIGIDNNVKRVQDVANEYKIKCFTELDEVEENIDCAFVCTSPQFHGDIISRCLEKDCHVFSEINLLDYKYKENIKLAKQKGKILFLSSTPMYKDEMKYIDAEIKKNSKNCVYTYHVGQYLPDWHPWDSLKEFFVGRPETNGCREFLAIELPWITKAFGKISKVNVMKRKISTIEVDFPDVFMVHIQHENGNMGNLLVDVVSRKAVRNLEVISEDLYIQWNGTPDTLYQKDMESDEMQRIQMGEYIHQDGYSSVINEYAYMTEIKAFFDAINGAKMIYDFEQDLEILSWIDIIEQ